MASAVSDPKFSVIEVQIPDRSIYDKGKPEMVSRYALVDDRNVVWVNGHGFGFLISMTFNDRSAQDCRHLLRETPEEALKDAAQWYDWYKGEDGNYHRVLL